MTSGISFHILYDAIDNNANPLRVAIASLQPRVINIVGGARKTQAFTFAVEMKKKYPTMRVIFRSWPDDGNHAKDQYKLVYHRDAFGNLIIDDYSGCQRWVDDNQSYLLAGLTVLTDNESMRSDLDVYSAWQAKIMDLTGAKGWSVAVGRFATGNPPKAQLPQLETMFRTLLKWGDLHCFSPNEYFSKDPTRNGGNIYRYKDATDYAKSIGAWPFPVTIGEFGLLYMDGSGRLDPEAGFKDGRVGIGSDASARFTIAQWKQWYRNEGVDVCLYCWGGDGSPKWERCRVDNDDGFLKALLTAATNGELEVMTTNTTTPAYTPAAFVAGSAYTLQSAGGARTNVRSAPIIDVTNQIGLLEDKTIVKILREVAIGVDWWAKISTDTIQEGYINLRGGAVTFTPLPVPVEVPPVEIPTPPPVIVDVPPAPFLEVSADKAKSFASLYSSLADTYAAMATDCRKLANDWQAVADQTTAKAA